MKYTDTQQKVAANKGTLTYKEFLELVNKHAPGKTPGTVDRGRAFDLIHALQKQQPELYLSDDVLNQDKARDYYNKLTKFNIGNPVNVPIDKPWLGSYLSGDAKTRYVHDPITGKKHDITKLPQDVRDAAYEQQDLSSYARTMSYLSELGDGPHRGATALKSLGILALGLLSSGAAAAGTYALTGNGGAAIGVGGIGTIASLVSAPLYAAAVDANKNRKQLAYLQDRDKALQRYITDSLAGKKVKRPQPLDKGIADTYAAESAFHNPSKYYNDPASSYPYDDEEEEDY